MPSRVSPPPLRLGATRTQSARSVRALRAALLEAIAAQLERYLNEDTTQTELARRLGLSRPRISRLLKRDVDLFGLDSLAAIAARSGLAVRLGIARPYRKR